MFGLLYMLGSGLAYAISGVKASYDNAQCRERGIQRDKLRYISTHTYIDRRGATRDITTNAYRTQTWDKYHDVWLEDFHGNKLRNLTQEKRMVEAAQKAAVAPPGTIAVAYEYWDHQTSRIKAGCDIVEGEVFIGIKTGDFYFKKRFHVNPKGEEVEGKGKNKWYPPDVVTCDYYMRISDGLLVCPTEDMVTQKKPISKQLVVDFMNYFNDEQKKGGYLNRKCEKLDKKLGLESHVIFPLEKYYLSDDDYSLF